MEKANDNGVVLGQATVIRNNQDLINDVSSLGISLYKVDEIEVEGKRYIKVTDPQTKQVRLFNPINYEFLDSQFNASMNPEEAIRVNTDLGRDNSNNLRNNYNVLMMRFISLEDLGVNFERYISEAGLDSDDAKYLRDVVSNYSVLKENGISYVNILSKLAMTNMGEIISLKAIMTKVNNKQSQNNVSSQELNKGRQFVMKKAGFMEMGMLIDVMVISIAIILLIMIILGTR